LCANLSGGRVDVLPCVPEGESQPNAEEHTVAPPIYNVSRLGQAEEQLAVKALIAKLAVEALIVAILATDPADHYGEAGRC